MTYIIQVRGLAYTAKRMMV